MDGRTDEWRLRNEGMLTTVKAITVIEAALDECVKQSELEPRVVLLPKRLFEQFEKERDTLASVLPESEDGKDDPRWCDVRVVENLRRSNIEVY